MSRARRFFSRCAMSLGLLALAPSARADTAARVVVVGPSAHDAVVVRLQRELGLLGIEVEVVVTSGDGRIDPAEVARSHHAAAVATVNASPPAVVLWVDPARRASGVSGDEVRVDQGAAPSADERLLVLRAVEIVRERLMPAPAEPPPGTSPGGAGTSPGGTTSGAPRDDRGPSVFLGPAVVAGPGGVGASPHGWLGAHWAPVSRLDLELVAVVPTVGSSVSAAEGSMTLRTGGGGVGAGVKLTPQTSSLFVTAGVGFAVLALAFAGQAQPPWQAASGLRASMLPFAHVAAGYWLSPRVALRADVLTGFALPEPVLTIAGRDVATFGEPMALFAASVEVRP